MKLVSAPPTFISATLQPQVEDFQNENRKLGSGCEYAIRCLPRLQKRSNRARRTRRAMRLTTLNQVYFTMRLFVKRHAM
jgi:hypothetical protein